MKSQYFLEVLFIMMHKVSLLMKSQNLTILVLTFEAVDEILRYDNSNARFFFDSSYIWCFMLTMLYKVVLPFASVYGLNPKM